MNIEYGSMIEGISIMGLFSHSQWKRKTQHNYKKDIQMLRIYVLNAGYKGVFH